MAVRYGNSISFAVPLLNGEVCIVDLWLLEAVKVFYPAFYEFVKSNPTFFIGGYSKRFSGGNDDDKKAQLKRQIEDLSVTFTRSEKDAIKDLLIDLFPVLNEVYYNYAYTYNTSWEKEKRICSTKYFNRYFTYSVIKGELSDIEFEDFISSVPNCSLPSVEEKVKLMIERSSAEAFLHKIRIFERELDWGVASKISKAIVLNSEDFPKNEHIFQLSFEHPNGQAIIFISQILKGHSDNVEILALAKELIKTAKPLSFACSLYYRIVPDNSDISEEKAIFLNEEVVLINKILISRAISEANGKSLVEKFPDDILTLFSAWKDADSNSFNKYIKQLLINQPNQADKLILAYTPVEHSSSHPEPYHTNLDEARFKYLTSFIDKKLIYDALKKVHTREELNSEEVKWIHRGSKNSDLINIIRQYSYWYKGMV